MRSHQPVFHIVKCSSAAGDGLLLGFSVAPMLFILCRSVRPGGGGVQAIWRVLKHFCVKAAHCHETTFL